MRRSFGTRCGGGAWHVSWGLLLHCLSLYEFAVSAWGEISYRVLLGSNFCMYVREFTGQLHVECLSRGLPEASPPSVRDREGVANWCDVVCETRWGAPGARRKACESGSGRGKFPRAGWHDSQTGWSGAISGGGGVGAAPALAPGYFRTGSAAGTFSRNVSAQRYLHRIWGSVPLSRVPSTAFGSYVREFSREGPFRRGRTCKHLVTILDFFLSLSGGVLYTDEAALLFACSCLCVDPLLFASFESPTASQGASSSRRPLAAKYLPAPLSLSRPSPRHSDRIARSRLDPTSSSLPRPVTHRARSSPHPRPTRRLALSDLTLPPPSTPNSTPP